jgi:Lar family restriction alleviation protein
MTTESPNPEQEVSEELLPCPRCGGSGDFEEQNPFFDADDEDSTEDEFHKIACSACTGAGKLSVCPCPHCGSTDVFVERADLSSAYVMCNDCAAHGPIGSTEGDDMEELPGGVEAIAAWNRRSALAPIEQEAGSGEAVLPCDVKLPPATTISAGCKLSTLMTALKVRGMNLAASASTPVTDAWQDMSSAPKDGTGFLAAYSDGRVVEAYYLDNSHTKMPWAGFRPVSSFETTKPGVKFTHWQPKPSPPALSQDPS